ncbi:hypothetical protein D3C83_54670 [compost metagenome]
MLSVPGDKHRVFVPVPGKLRLLLEVLVALAGVWAAHTAWSIPWASALLMATAVTFVASRARVRWLWQH